MKRLLLLLLTFSIAHPGDAQKVSGSVHGTVQDSATALPNATVSLMRAADSSLFSFILTSNSGNFEIKGLSSGSYVLSVSYQGFQTLAKPFSISAAAPVVDL